MTVSQPTFDGAETTNERLARLAIGGLFILMGLAFALLLNFKYFDFHYERFVGSSFVSPTPGSSIFTHELLEMDESWLLGLALCWAGAMTLQGKDFGRKLGIVLSLVTLLIALVFSYLAFVLSAVTPSHNSGEISPFTVGYPVCVVISLAALAYFFTWGQKLDRGQSRNWLWAAGSVVALASIVAVGALTGKLH